MFVECKIFLLTIAIRSNFSGTQVLRFSAVMREITSSYINTYFLAFFPNMQSIFTVQKLSLKIVNVGSSLHSWHNLTHSSVSLPIVELALLWTVWHIFFKESAGCYVHTNSSYSLIYIQMYFSKSLTSEALSIITFI